MNTITSKTVVFVTGAFVSHLGWEPWKAYFESKGFSTHSPAWPHKEGTPKELRDLQPNDIPLARLTLAELVDHYADFVKKLPEKPVVIGHSLGGLITQILVNRDLTAAGAVLHPVPPLGVFPYEFTFLKAGWKSLGLFTNLDKTYLMSLSDWQYAFTNGMTLAEQKKSWEENTIPESKRVARGGLTSAAAVDFKKPHAPLLIISGSTDHIIPAHLNLRNYKKYDTPGSVTDYKEFEGKNHFVVSLPSWHDEADYILDWIARN
jgi:pimeloyl-ACP methyl ester carboxylesterase